MKNKKIRLFGLMAVLTVLLSVAVISCCRCPSSVVNCECPVPGPGGTGKFYGKVTNKNTGAGISGAYLDFAGPTNYGTTTNSIGNYKTTLLNSGIYNITVTASGYQTINDNNVTLPDGQWVKKDYPMTPNP